MGPSLSQHARNAHQIEARQRLERLRAFSPDQLAAGLIWLSGYDPGTFDAVLDAAEPYTVDDDPSGGEPEPVCGVCGEQIGIFLRLGLDWRHYRETREASVAGERPGRGGMIIHNRMQPRSQMPPPPPGQAGPRLSPRPTYFP